MHLVDKGLAILKKCMHNWLHEIMLQRQLLMPTDAGNMVVVKEPTLTAVTMLH